MGRSCSPHAYTSRLPVLLYEERTPRDGVQCCGSETKSHSYFDGMCVPTTNILTVECLLLAAPVPHGSGLHLRSQHSSPSPGSCRTAQVPLSLDGVDASVSERTTAIPGPTSALINPVWGMRTRAARHDLLRLRSGSQLSSGRGEVRLPPPPIYNVKKGIEPDRRCDM